MSLKLWHWQHVLDSADALALQGCLQAFWPVLGGSCVPWCPCQMLPASHAAPAVQLRRPLHTAGCPVPGVLLISHCWYTVELMLACLCWAHACTNAWALPPPLHPPLHHPTPCHPLSDGNVHILEPPSSWGCYATGAAGKS